jgi:hypothetical protein
VGDSRDHDVRPAHQLEVPAIARGAERVDVGGPEAPRAGEVPGAPPLAQEQVDVRSGVQIDPDACQRLLVRAEVEVFRVDEDAVVVEQDRVERRGRRGAQGSSSSLRNSRMSPIRSMR